MRDSAHMLNYVASLSSIVFVYRIQCNQGEMFFLLDWRAVLTEAVVSCKCRVNACHARAVAHELPAYE